MNPLKGQRMKVGVYFAVSVMISFAMSYPVLAQMPAMPGAPAAAPGVARAPVKPGAKPAGTQGLKLSGPISLILEDYAARTKRTLLIAPGVALTAQVDLRSQDQNLTLEECLEAEEAVLGMNNIGLIKVGEKFLKVVPAGGIRKEPMLIQETLPDDNQLKESDVIVSQLIRVNYIDIAEAERVISALKHEYVPILKFEGSILVTDSASTINRILQILKLIDVESQNPDKPFFFPIRFSTPSLIKQKLDEIIADSQKDAAKPTIARPRDSGAPGFTAATPVPAAAPGLPVIRPPLITTPATGGGVASDVIDSGDRGMVRGKVKIIADDRTTQLIIITRDSNRKFLEDLIAALDVAPNLDVMVNILRLEYADADDVGGSLKDLIGQVDKSKPAVTGTPGAPAAPGTPKVAPGVPAPSLSLPEIVASQTAPVTGTTKEKSKLGELSSNNIKILVNKRTNSLIVMSSKADFEQIKELVKNMDLPLDEVLIESVIVQIDLDDKLTSGIQWVQRALIAYDQRADGSHNARGAFAGSAGGGGTPLPASGLTSIGGWGANAGLTTYFTHFGLNLDAIVKLVKSDSRAHTLSSPVIVTTDNTKATIKSTQDEYFLKGNVVDQFGNSHADVGSKTIGMTLDVKPRVGKGGNVMMEISQEISDPGGVQTIQGQDWPITKTRNLSATISVQDRETIVLGGLIRREDTRSGEGVPILSSIPLIGRLFKSQSDHGARTEIVVFITPYVLGSQDAIARESARRKANMSMQGVWKKDWSDSKLADDPGARLDRSSPKQEVPPAKTGRVLVAPVAVSSNGNPKPAKPVKDPAASIDPDMSKFMKEQDEKYGKALEDLDKQVEKQLAEEDNKKQK